MYMCSIKTSFTKANCFVSLARGGIWKIQIKGEREREREREKGRIYYYYCYYYYSTESVKNSQYYYTLYSEA